MEKGSPPLAAGRCRLCPPPPPAWAASCWGGRVSASRKHPKSQLNPLLFTGSFPVSQTEGDACFQVIFTFTNKFPRHTPTSEKLSAAECERVCAHTHTHTRVGVLLATALTRTGPSVSVRRPYTADPGGERAFTSVSLGRMEPTPKVPIAQVGCRGRVESPTLR